MIMLNYIIYLFYTKYHVKKLYTFLRESQITLISKSKMNNKENFQNYLVKVRKHLTAVLTAL